MVNFLSLQDCSHQYSDEEILKRKVQSLIDCFLESVTNPPVQVSVRFLHATVKHLYLEVIFIWRNWRYKQKSPKMRLQNTVSILVTQQAILNLLACWYLFCLFV